MAHIVVVDENDVPIGTKERSAIDQHDIYRVSALWLTNSKGEILLAQRALTKSHDPGRWGPAVAGAVEAGENYESNIVKEIAEELGVQIPISDLRIGPKLRVRGKHQFFDQWYFGTLDINTTDFKLQKDEVESVKWFSKDELLSALADRPSDFIPSFSEGLELFLDSTDS